MKAKKPEMKIVLDRILVAIAVVVLGLGLVKMALDKPIPKGESGKRAELLAAKMLHAINDSAWQATGAVRWNFDNRHELLWDKKRHLAKVAWDNCVVYLNCHTKSGYAEVDGKAVDADEQNELLERAYFIWANDSYWLNPVSKIYDEGVERKLVQTENGSEALLVTYTQGGVTPGDSYLWFADDQGRPYKCQMWVKIIPIKGVEASWENWQQSSTGVWYATKHQMGQVQIELLDVEMTTDLKEWYGADDVFAKFK